MYTPIAGGRWREELLAECRVNINASAITCEITRTLFSLSKNLIVGKCERTEWLCGFLCWPVRATVFVGRSRMPIMSSMTSACMWPIVIWSAHIHVLVMEFIIGMRDLTTNTVALIILSTALVLCTVCHLVHHLSCPLWVSVVRILFTDYTESLLGLYVRLYYATTYCLDIVNSL